MQATESTTAAIPASTAIPAKTNYSLKETSTLTGDGVKTLLQLVQDLLATTTGLDKVLGSGKTAELSERLHIEAESADLYES